MSHPSKIISTALTLALCLALTPAYAKGKKSSHKKVEPAPCPCSTLTGQQIAWLKKKAGKPSTLIGYWTSNSSFQVAIFHNSAYYIHGLQISGFSNEADCFSTTHLPALPVNGSCAAPEGETCSWPENGLTLPDSTGLQIAGWSNESHRFAGIQLAGADNNSRGLAGVQLAGLYNNAASETANLKTANMPSDYEPGLQLAGLWNAAKNLKGIQIAGLTNHSTGLNGIQISLLGNQTESLYGIQLTGLINVVSESERTEDVNSPKKQLTERLSATCGGNMCGVQLAGLANRAHNARGLQIAGLFNNVKTVKGVQIAGILNWAETVEGIQIGLINYCQKLHGIQLGLMNIVHDDSTGPKYMVLLNARF